ncbi:hypothetical protein HOG98_02015 [bacterium]|nr:hypothetical protein [bacterium]
MAIINIDSMSSDNQSLYYPSFSITSFKGFESKKKWFVVFKDNKSIEKFLINYSSFLLNDSQTNFEYIYSVDSWQSLKLSKSNLFVVDIESFLTSDSLGQQEFFNEIKSKPDLSFIFVFGQDWIQHNRDEDIFQLNPLYDISQELLCDTEQNLIDYISTESEAPVLEKKEIPKTFIIKNKAGKPVEIDLSDTKIKEELGEVIGEVCGEPDLKSDFFLTQAYFDKHNYFNKFEKGKPFEVKSTSEDLSFSDKIEFLKMTNATAYNDIKEPLPEHEDEDVEFLAYV